ncbi:MAG: Zinc uptake regulation protein [Alphaproteobacteria bacterium MarineAlpha8_Bin1]|nr:MAG: Zinc uptake regulation protein [Alphaproteobacteria bacterium MarineAlpha8_Bin1]|tara:strand:+ start:269 stop:697 length:429 start_codon:yes stop_codon:yes gene_type:complete
MNNLLEKKAVDFCIKNKHRLTVPRLNVLKILTSSSKPMTAYQILKKLGELMDNPKPPTAYRAIEFWKKYNFVHRIESLNAYSVCSSNHLHSGGQFMICNDCGKVIETHLCSLPSAFKKILKEQMFTLSNWNLEISGVCKKCS